MYSPKIRDDLIPILYRLAVQEGKPMTRLVDDILRAVVERRLLVLDLQQHPDPAGSLKKTPDEWRTEKLPGRKDFPLGLRPSVHPSPME